MLGRPYPRACCVFRGRSRLRRCPKRSAVASEQHCFVKVILAQIIDQLKIMPLKIMPLQQRISSCSTAGDYSGTAPYGVLQPQQLDFGFGGGTSSAGLAVKKPTGIQWKLA
jgi:hypothetical protein